MRSWPSVGMRLVAASGLEGRWVSAELCSRHLSDGCTVMVDAAAEASIPYFQAWTYLLAQQWSNQRVYADVQGGYQLFDSGS